MCGIVGVAGNLTMMTTGMFRDMLIFDTVRGMDSTGVVAVNNDNSVKWEKELGGPTNLFALEKDSIFDFKGRTGHMHKVLLGHNRAATIGKVTVDNAHPFEFSNIVGVHNGTLDDWFDLEGYKEFDVDSKALLNTIQKKGIAHTWKSFVGAAAVVWWDSNEKTLNFIRNDKRPLYYGYNKSKSVIFWSSEFWIAEIAAYRNKVDLNKNDKDEVVYHAFEADHHYKFEVGVTDVKLVTKTKLEKKVPIYTGNRWGYYDTKWRETKTYGSTGTNKIPDLMNFTWADGLAKAPKEMVGLEFQLKYCIEAPSSDMYYFIGDILDDKYKSTTQRVEIYPKNKKEWDRMKDFIKEDSKTRVVRMKFTSRPRIKTFGVPSNSFYKAYCIDSQHVKLSSTFNVIENKDYKKTDGDQLDWLKDSKTDTEILYPGPNCQILTLDELKRAFEVAGNSCGWCGGKLVPEEAHEYEWYGSDCFCAECIKNNYQQLAYYRQNY